MAEVKWIKITTDMFDNRKIKHIRKLPEGNNIVLIWVMLLTMAGKCNAGGFIFLMEDIPYTTKMLADELDFDESVIKVAITALERFGMISSENDMYMINGWEEHQNKDGLEKIREQARVRQAKYRDKQKQIGSNAERNVTVTSHNALDIDKDIDKEKDNKDIVEQSTTKYPYKEVIDYLNLKTGRGFKDKSKDSRRHIRARIDEGYTLDDFKKVIDVKVAEWGKSEKMHPFLRPSTLFGSEKNFEAYLNQQKGVIINDTGRDVTTDDGELVSQAIQAGVNTEFEGF